MSGPYGIIYDEPLDRYHANDAWSNSKVQTFRRSRLEAYQRYVVKTRPGKPPKQYQVIGQAVHCAVLEGHKVFAERFVLNPYDNFRTKEAQAWRADQQLQGREVLGRDQADTVATCIERVKADPLAAVLLSAGRPEVTFRKHLAHFDIQSRTDYFNGDGVQLPTGAGADEFTGSYFLELKTVTTVDEHGEEKDIWEIFRGHFRRYAYYMQAAWNREVIAELTVEAGREQVRPAVYYIVVQTDDPFDCIVCQPSARALAVATTEIRAELARIDTCYRTGIWNGVYEVELPYYFEQRTLASQPQREQLGI